MKVKAGSREIAMRPYGLINQVVWFVSHHDPVYALVLLRPREIERMYLQHPQSIGPPCYYAVEGNRLTYFPRNKEKGEIRVRFFPPEEEI